MTSPSVKIGTSLSLSNAPKHTIQTPHHFDSTNIDEEAFAAAKAQADVVNNTLHPVKDELIGLTSVEARITIEQKYKPLLMTAIHKHREACDDVTHFESSADVFLIREKTRYAYELKHPEIVKIQCAGNEHMQHLLRTGALNKEGYKLADARALTSDAGSVTNTRTTFVLIPNEKASLADYAATAEAKEWAENLYQLELKKLLSKRNAAAVALQALREEVAAKWDSVPDFEDLFRSGVRKGRK